MLVAMRSCWSLLVLVLGCSSSAEPEPSAEPRAPEPIAEPSPGAVELAGVDDGLDDAAAVKLRAAVAGYLAWGRVDERPNLAPALCRAPTGLDFGFPSHARLSEADDAPHGRKLYFLYAGPPSLGGRDRYAGLGLPDRASELPVGFTVVKQSWSAEPKPTATATPTDQPNAAPELPADAFVISTDPPAPITWVEHAGQRLHVGAQAELFVMTKVGAPDLPGSDRGWIYGTLTPDGQTVTSAGLVERCMACHAEATHERLFGLQPTKVIAELPGALPPELGLER